MDYVLKNCYNSKKKKKKLFINNENLEIVFFIFYPRLNNRTLLVDSLLLSSYVNKVKNNFCKMSNLLLIIIFCEVFKLL